MGGDRKLSTHLLRGDEPCAGYNFSAQELGYSRLVTRCARISHILEDLAPAPHAHNPCCIQATATGRHFWRHSVDAFDRRLFALIALYTLPTIQNVAA